MLRVVLLAFVILTVSGHAAEDATPRFSLDLLRARSPERKVARATTRAALGSRLLVAAVVAQQPPAPAVQRE